MNKKNSKKDFNFKYDEDKIIGIMMEHMQATYSQHYVGEDDIQTVDVWYSLGSAATTVRDNAIKYLMRYGKKGGKNPEDLKKIIHFVILLWYFSQTKNLSVNAPKDDDK